MVDNNDIDFENKLNNSEDDDSEWELSEGELESELESEADKPIDGGKLSNAALEALEDIEKYLDETEEESLPYQGNEKIKSGQPVPTTTDNFILASLENEDLANFETRLYKTSKVKEKEKERENKFISGQYTKNKFISRPNDSIDIEELKESWNKDYVRGLDSVDQKTTDVVKINKNVKTNFTESLDKSIAKVKEFLINEIAPLDMSLENAFAEVNQILSIIIDDNVTLENKQAVTMINDALQIKLFDFIAKELKLTKDQKQLIMNKQFVIKPSKQNTHTIVRNND